MRSACMKGHYLYGCDYKHFQHLLKENEADLDPCQAERIEECRRYSRFLTRFAKIERFFWDRRIRNMVIDKPPLFILGHWRSGTTYLFNLPSCDPETSFMDSMTTFTFHNFLLLRYHLPKHYSDKLTGDRYGDDMEFLPHSPQEECYAIANCIDETFTHLITFPQNYQKYMDYAFEDGLTPEQRQRWCDTHSYLLKKISYFRKGKRILFKSPDNTAKLGMLHNLYPDAKFVHIYRDPYKVLLSTIHMFEEGIQAMTFEKVPSHELVVDMAIRFYKRIYTQYLKDMARVPKEQLVEISYSDLVKAPMETLEQIYRDLDLPGFEAARPLMQAHVDSQKSYKPNRFDLDPVLRDKINAELGFFFEHYHIPMKTAEGES